MKPLESANAKPSIALFAVVRDDGSYFAGFDPAARQSASSATVFGAKLFTDKFSIRLQPDERIVEVRITMDESNVTLSNPFRPRRRTSSNVTQATVRE